MWRFAYDPDALSSQMQRAQRTKPHQVNKDYQNEAQLDRIFNDMESAASRDKRIFKRAREFLGFGSERQGLEVACITLAERTFDIVVGGARYLFDSV